MIEIGGKKMKNDKEIIISKLQKELEKEKELAEFRLERNKLEDEILKWRNTGKSQKDTHVKENIKKMAVAVGKEISFYGNNVRDNIEKEHSIKKKGKLPKGSKDEWTMI